MNSRWFLQKQFISDLIVNGADLDALAAHYVCTEPHMRKILRMLGMTAPKSGPGRGGHNTVRDTSPTESEAARKYLTKMQVAYQDVELRQ